MAGLSEDFERKEEMKDEPLIEKRVLRTFCPGELQFAAGLGIFFGDKPKLAQPVSVLDRVGFGESLKGGKLSHTQSSQDVGSEIELAQIKVGPEETGRTTIDAPFTRLGEGSTVGETDGERLVDETSPLFCTMG